MAETNVRQRLAAILTADVASYSRLMSRDELGTMAALDSARGIFREFIEAHQGRVIDMAGDSVLAVFDTATGAVAAALAVQESLFAIGAAVPEDRRMRFRIGVHLGDVMEKADGTVYGDGVNIAARLEGLAEPGGIMVSGAVQGAVRGKLNARFIDLGERRLKNIAEPVNAFRILAAGAESVQAKIPIRNKALIIFSVAAALGASVAIYYAWQPSREDRTGSRPVSPFKEDLNRLILLADQKAEQTQVASASPTPKAESRVSAAPQAMSRSERERLRDEEAATKTLAAAAPAPAAKSPEAEILYQQALAMERDGKAAAAIRIYRRAARSGSGKAAKRLGDIFDGGVPGVSRDYAESLQWYEVARQLGEDVPLSARR